MYEDRKQTYVKTNITKQNSHKGEEKCDERTEHKKANPRTF